ncbi:amidohydrolase [Saccharibacillus sp. JS10]|uniref:amidohydrolase family protein n=1 Tax=Saccharibacillus sp. JS10 TaxID=2950552 RepID=UPI00210B4DBC|nr:amidohydrolase family protein [Saccharibacillus sp. JS10]MCQ4085467.1 amidohydrolase family protein [Saccharibacillus sp. JS10]
MRIDAHQHYWKIQRGDYGWITPELPVLYRDFLPVDFEPLLQKHQLGGSILVQAAPTLEETEYILSLADENPSILGVVGWIDLFDPDHRTHYNKFRTHPKFRGFRIMIQDMEDPSKMLIPSFVDALRGYAAEQVPIDLLLTSPQMEITLQLLEKVPNLYGVIDHIAKPQIAKGEFESWASNLSQFAKYPGLFCKLSGMVTEANPSGWKPEDFVPYVRHVLKAFGPERVMFGSDWPVCLLAADYDQVVDILEQALPPAWSQADRDLLFGENAKRFYLENGGAIS